MISVCFWSSRSGCTFTHSAPAASEPEASATPDATGVKGNLKRFHGESAASAVEEAAFNYQSPSMIALGADAQRVSVLAFLVNLMLSVICCRAPALIERLGFTRRGAVLLALLNLFVWVPLIVYFVFSRTPVTSFWFILIWLVNMAPAVLLSTQRDNWLSNLIPRNIMGRYLGQRLAIRSACYLAAFCLSGYLLDSFKDEILTGFTTVFVIAFLASFVNFLIYLWMDDPKNAVAGVPEQPGEFGFFDFLGELEDVKLNTFVLFTSLFGVTVSLCGPLYAVYMLNELHFSYLSFTAVISAEYLARVIGMPLWGHFTDRVGNIRVLTIVSRIIPFLPISWLFLSSLGYLIFIQIISGLCWGAYDLSTQNYLFKMAPPARKLRYIVYSKSLSLFCMALGGLLSVYLLQEVVPVFGSRILGIFLISGIFRGLVALYMLPRLVDLAVSYGAASPRAVIDEAALKKMLASRSGMYFHPELWEKSPEAFRPISLAASPKARPAPASPGGIYYHPEKWAQYPGNAVAAGKAARETARAQASRGLYHNPQAWRQYQQDSRQEMLKDRQAPVNVPRYARRPRAPRYRFARAAV